MRGKRKIRIAAAVAAALFAAYTVFIYFLVSACLVPSFMDKLNAFEDITRKCYSEQVQTADIQENRSQLLTETGEWLETVERRKIQVRTTDGYLLTAAEFPAGTGDKWALLLHGYTGWKEEMYQFACWYHQQGYSVLVPDLRCQGESEGDFIGMGWTAKGNYVGCFPANTDVKDYFIPVSRMFDWIGNTLIRTFWSKLDLPMTKRLLDTIQDTCSIWLNGLVSSEILLGARVEILGEENPVTSLMAGIIKIHIYITPPSPAQEIDFVLEYDPDYVTSALLSE